MGAFGAARWARVLGGRVVIFVTVGTQLSFDRLVCAVDKWASKTPDAKVFAQIGPSQDRPKKFESQSMLSPAKATQLFIDADVVVSHAGMGSILTALQYCKPIIIMPRRADFGEHRNDHQVATAKWLGSRPGIYVASDGDELERLLDQRATLSAGGEICDSADSQLISRLRSVIKGN